MNFCLQLNSISLSKNIMRSLQASKADMPPLDAFPKSHQVTFKYYAGVISFLEEDYFQVRPLPYSQKVNLSRQEADVALLPTRPSSI